MVTHIKFICIRELEASYKKEPTIFQLLKSATCVYIDRHPLQEELSYESIMVRHSRTNVCSVYELGWVLQICISYVAMVSSKCLAAAKT